MSKRESFLILMSVGWDCQADRREGGIIHHREGLYQRIQQARRSGREARYQQAVAWHKQGMTTKEIASRLRLGQRTVQRWLAAGSFQYKSSRRKRPSAFDAFAPYVLKRWKEGQRNGLALWREIKEQGYDGSDRSLYR